jgi:hypothetical protein
MLDGSDKRYCLLRHNVIVGGGIRRMDMQVLRQHVFIYQCLIRELEHCRGEILPGLSRLNCLITTISSKGF